MKQYLFLMLGPPGSGKSFFARQLAVELGAVRLNADGIRYKMFSLPEERFNRANNPLVFGALDYVTEQVLVAGHSVVFDVSHNRVQDREGKRLLAAKFGIKPVLVWMQVPIDVARERMSTREIAPDQPAVPPGRFEDLVSNLQPPTDEDDYIKIDGILPFEQQLQSFNRQLIELEA